MRSIAVLLICIGLGTASTVYGFCSGDEIECQAKLTPKWTVTSLSQHVSQHDGPNCFNAALVAAGFSDDIVYVDALEYAFYLERFCKRQSKDPMLKGNLLVYLGVEPHPFSDGNATKLQHGAFSIGEGKILEKTSIHGSLFGKKEGREVPGVYQVKNLSRSAFATRASGTKIVQGYKCQSPEEIRTKIDSLNEDPLARHLNTLRRQVSIQIETMPLARIRGLNEELKMGTQALSLREGTSESDLYVAALARSLVGTIESVLNEREENSDRQLTESTGDFLSASFQLIDKINAKTTFAKSNPLLLMY